MATSFSCPAISSSTAQFIRAVKTLERHPNVLFDFSARTADGSPVARESFFRFADRILFGTDLLPGCGYVSVALPIFSRPKMNILNIHPMLRGSDVLTTPRSIKKRHLERLAGASDAKLEAERHTPATEILTAGGERDGHGMDSTTYNEGTANSRNMSFDSRECQDNHMEYVAATVADGNPMKIQGQPTVSDVARRAGVGTTTVSRVINGGARVSAETFATVSRVIEELGFVPNLAARMLKGERSKTIGLIVPSIADPFFASCAEAIQNIARSFGCLVVVCVSRNEAELEIENIDTLCRRVDGILIAPSQSNDKVLIMRLASLSIPVVSFDQPLGSSSIPGVLTDNYHSAKGMTEHLLQHGYERILCMAGETTYTMLERARGYTDAMREAGRQPLIDTAPELRTEEETTAVLWRHLGGCTPPRAIYCLKNIKTIQTYDVLQKFGVRVPQQIALAGHDDFQLAATLRPSITVVQQPVEEIGRVAAKLLFEKLLHQVNTSPSTRQENRVMTVRLASRLIFRASCGCEEVRPTGAMPHLNLPQ